MNGVYPMLVVERLTGLSRRQIRYFEAKGLLKVGRTPAGHRLYSPAEVERLLTIVELRQQGFYALNTVRRMLDSAVTWPRHVRRSPAPMVWSRSRNEVGEERGDATHHFHRQRVLNELPGQESTNTGKGIAR